jgi:acetolactate synthase I/II/III large subunit
MKASDLFVKCLENEGVKYVFSVPGEENLDLSVTFPHDYVRGDPGHNSSSLPPG